MMFLLISIASAAVVRREDDAHSMTSDPELAQVDPVLLEPITPRRNEEVSFAEMPDFDPKRTSEWSRNLMEKKTKLGAGSYGTVFLVRPTCGPSSSYALKVQRPRSPNDRYWEPEMNSEVKLMLKFNSVRFVQMLDYGFGKTKAGTKMHSILMEAASSDLGKYMSKDNSWEQVVVFMADLLEGISEMHKAGVVHRDLKPGNVLVKCVEGGPCHAKIADLGMSCILGKPDCSGIGGTPLYFAPELLKSQQPSPSNDMWGMGVMMYELVFKTMPRGITGRSLEDLYANIKKIKDTAHITEQNVGARMPGASSAVKKQAYELLKGLLEPTPANRLSGAAAAGKARALVEGVKVTPLTGVTPPCWEDAKAVPGGAMPLPPKPKREPEPEPPKKVIKDKKAPKEEPEPEPEEDEQQASDVGEEDFVAVAKPGTNMAAALVLKWAQGMDLAEIQKTSQKYLPKALRTGKFQLFDINKYTPAQIKESRELAEGLKGGVYGDLIVHVKVLQK